LRISQPTPKTNKRNQERKNDVICDENGTAEHAALDARFPGGAEKGLELFGRLLPRFQPFQVGGGLVGQLLTRGLDGEVFLGAGDLRLAGIAVLGDQARAIHRRRQQ
jgi:hypothetical protein